MKRLCFACVLAGAMTAMAGFEAGFARVDITPPLGVPLAGYFSYREATSVADPLEATCVAFSDGTHTALVYTVDNIHLANDQIADAWQAITAATGVPKERILIASTHIHTGPVTEESYYVGKTPAESLPRVKALVVNNNAMTVSRLADAGRAACSDLAPSTMKLAQGTCPDIAFIRRFRMKDGSVRTNPGLHNPDIAAPIGASDEGVQLIRFIRPGKKEIAIVTFQTHPDVIGGTVISADWPGFARRTIEQTFGGQVQCALFNGAQGDSNHINVNWKTPPEHPGGTFAERYAFSRRMGRKIAGTALSIWDDALEVETGVVGGHVTDVKIAANVPTAAELARARKINDLYRADQNAVIRDEKGRPYQGMERATILGEAGRMVKLANGPEYFMLPVSTITIGRALAFAGFPGEPFQEAGIYVKAKSPFRMTVISCTTNGTWGYFGTKAAYDEGGYEARSSRFKAGVLETLRDALLADLK